MKKFIYDSWNMIMDHRLNPLSNVQDLGVRHVVMQFLAWMWCIIFSMSIGSITVFGISVLAHALLIAGIVATVGMFEAAKRKPELFTRYKYGVNYSGRGYGGEHE